MRARASTLGHATHARLRRDVPFGWRITAHTMVLVIIAGVLLASQFPSVAAFGPESEGKGRLADWALRLSENSAFWRPLPDVGVMTGPRAQEGTGGSPDEASPGFISPGLAAEADPALLPWDEPQVYVVQAGDTISGIADQFGVAPETLLYANPSVRENPHSLSVGDTLTILPIDGVLHIVQDGDTLQSIADRYKSKVEDILGYVPNGLVADAALVAGTEVVVPGGEMEIVIPSMYQYDDAGTRSTMVWASDGGRGPVSGSGSFHIASYGRFSQGYTRWHGAVDIANSTGTPIYAVDGGTVEVAGWIGALGNAVVIDHGNGFESLYGHMSAVNVGGGQTVQRGQIIGTIGCTRGRGGRCTGPHLHLEIFQNGRRVNPCAVGACP